jgi:NADH-quinone oxidoreductase subunit J
MNDPQRILAVSTLLGAFGLYLLLPRGQGQGRALGLLLALAGGGGWASQLPGVGDWLSTGLFGVIAGVTIVSAMATVTFRSPVYCAIWFGMTLAGTAGLFLMAGAEFLAVATIVVYAGAILVTFLFVLMLSQPEGHTSYDRQSWEPLLSAFTGAMIVGILSMTIAGVMTTAQAGTAAAASREAHGVLLASDHVARLGAELFTRHLVAVETAGTLLFAALVGAAAIVSQGRGQRK